MSQTYSLVCHETRQSLWVGQGRGTMTTFYSGEASTMDRLGRFLAATQGKPLMLLCTDEGGDWIEYSEFEGGGT